MTSLPWVAGPRWSGNSPSIFGNSVLFISGCSISIVLSWVSLSGCSRTTPQPYRIFGNGGKFLAALKDEAQLLRWKESLGITLVPQFIMGAWNVIADSLSCQDQVIGSEWTLAQKVVDEVASNGRPLCHLPQLPSSRLLLPPERPTGGGDKCVPSVLVRSPGVCLSPVRPHLTSDQQASFLQGHPSNTHGSVVAPEEVVPRALEPFGGSSGRPSITCRSQTAPCPSSSPEPPRAAASCVETVQQFARYLGLSRGVARQLSLCRRNSSRQLYQHRWECYWCWCTDGAILCPIRPFPRLRISCRSSTLKSVSQFLL